MWNLINKVYAQTTVPLSGGSGGGSVVINPPTSMTTIPQLVTSITNYIAFVISPPLIVLLIIFGAFQMLTAGGEPEKFANGRRTILYAIIGYVVIVVAAALVGLIQSIV